MRSSQAKLSQLIARSVWRGDAIPILRYCGIFINSPGFGSLYQLLTKNSRTIGFWFKKSGLEFSLSLRKVIFTYFSLLDLVYVCSGGVEIEIDADLRTEVRYLISTLESRFIERRGVAYICQFW